MRLTIKKPMTERAQLLLLRKLYALHGAGEDANRVLDQSTFNSWTDVYPVHQQQARIVPNGTAFSRDRAAQASAWMGSAAPQADNVIDLEAGHARRYGR